MYLYSTFRLQFSQSFRIETQVLLLRRGKTVYLAMLFHWGWLILSPLRETLLRVSNLLPQKLSDFKVNEENGCQKLTLSSVPMHFYKYIRFQYHRVACLPLLVSLGYFLRLSLPFSLLFLLSFTVVLKRKIDTGNAFNVVCLHTPS